jgi:hypothetical protein
MTPRCGTQRSHLVRASTYLSVALSQMAADPRGYAATNATRSDGRTLCKTATGPPPELLRDQITRIYGAYTTMYLALPRPLAAMIRQWVKPTRQQT